ncbi:GNAT superfamily N-acetyltransferase [Lewinella marina]|uniref:N-acetyltransferase domain-containing protein n=1 Tax=Neolewinella marina TaxID=438751 RepID=A0A2G0CHK4_9BACT|nr:GNAT family N-acetyltransferase [Neolewinella marina]NJB86075.1 GNAT superfamily N-acetyltransferase [Neolewinella marina]PHK99446.1 hypothetical protein CGL56_08315 [Neolewinella marina]
MEISPPEISYAPLRESDQPQLAELMDRIYPPAYAHFWPDGGRWYLDSQYGPENFAREMADPAAVYQFVLYEGREVGIVRTLPGLSPPEQPGASATKLHRLYLDPRLHGRGLGRRVVEDVSRSSRQRGDELLWLEAMDTSSPALAFYDRLGFARLSHFTLDMPRMYPARRGMWRLAKSW